MWIIWYRLPLALKIALPMALLSVLSALSIVAITEYTQQRQLDERTDKLGNALASRLAASAARPLVQNDALSLQAALAGFAEEDAVQRTVVFDLKQQLVAAAGDPNPDSLEYSATIHWQDSAIGQAVLSLRPVAGDTYPQLGDLVLLSLILAALSAVCGLWLGHRAESILSAVTRKLGGEQIDLDYRGTDILARMLEVPPPPLLVAEPEATAKALVVLHLRAAHADDAGKQRALELAQMVGSVYGGKAAVTRADGITARFPVGDDFEGPFRAVCAAQLLLQFEKDAEAAAGSFRIALAVLPADEVGDIWRTEALTSVLQKICELAPAGALMIDNSLRRHPAIVERCVLADVVDATTGNGMAAENGFWRVDALQSPYDVLLERQFATLREQPVA
jgi:hypothetical protein